MRIQASSMRLVLRLPGSCARSCPRTSRGARLKERTRPLSAVVKSRRLMWGAFMSGPPIPLRRTHDRTDDAIVSAATAEIDGKRRAHVDLLRLRVALEQIGRRHDH